MVHQVQRPGTEVERVVSPRSLDQALRSLARPGSRALAGGTDLLLELARGEHDRLDTLVDLTRVPGLDSVAEAGGTVTIGALVTHNRVVADPLLQRAAGPLVQACREIGSPQLRNRATVVGNVVTASPANDTISALVALDATIHVASLQGERRVPIGHFHPGFRQTALQAGELVTAVSFPALGPPWRGIFLKLGNRRAQAISVVHLALVARLASGSSPSQPPRLDEARLALGSVAPTVVRAPAVEDLIRGRALDRDLIARAGSLAAAEVDPIDDVRATAAYRSSLVDEMVRRALRALGQGDLANPAAGLVDPDPIRLQGTGDGGPATAAPPTGEHRVDTAVTLTVNGAPLTRPRGHGSLLEWLRRAGLTGTKEGCAEGECGACTVDLDGQAVLSCLVPPSRAHGAEVVTVEGLVGLARGPGGDRGRNPTVGSGQGALHRLQEAFVEAGAVQCGYCIPGFLVSGVKLLEERSNPTRAEVEDGLAGNLCRCTGYYKIIDAVVRAGEGG